MSQTFLLFDDLDSFEEYCSGIMKTIPWLHFLCFFPLVRLVLWVLEESTWGWGGFPGGSAGKEHACQFRRCKRHRFSPWIGKILWRRKCNPLQYSCLENFMDRGAWWATVQGCKESDTTKHACARTHTHTQRTLWSHNLSLGMLVLSTWPG